MITEKQIQLVSDWNSARYEQEYNHKLTVQLFNEEHIEFLKAENLIDRLDGIGDMTFIAIGAMWKMGIDMEHLRIIHTFTSNDNQIFTLNNRLKKVNNIGLEVQKVEQLQHMWSRIFYDCNLVFNLNESEFAMLVHDCLEAVIVSNNTKFISKKKTASNKKANLIKGDAFIPPTKDLISIAKKYFGYVEPTICKE